MGGKASGRNESENLPCRLCFIQTPGKGFMDFFMQSKHLLALLCAICARLLSLPGIYAQGADSLRYLLDDFVIMDSGEEDDVTTGALLYKMECVDLTRRGMATLADAVRRMPGARLQLLRQILEKRLA